MWSYYSHTETDHRTETGKKGFGLTNSCVFCWLSVRIVQQCIPSELIIKTKVLIMWDTKWCSCLIKFLGKDIFVSIILYGNGTSTQICHCSLKMNNGWVGESKGCWLTCEVTRFTQSTRNPNYNIQHWLQSKCKYMKTLIFTRDQFWAVMACVSLCVSVCVCVCVPQSRACPRDNLSHIQASITKFGSQVQNSTAKIPIVLGVAWPWPPW